MDDLKEVAKNIDETTAIILKQIGEGKSMEDIQKSGLPDKYAPLGVALIDTNRWIEIVYTSYTR